jgi:hypothetical protein
MQPAKAKQPTRLSQNTDREYVELTSFSLASYMDNDNHAVSRRENLSPLSEIHNTMNGSNGVPKPTSGFLSFNSHPPRVYITSEDDDFDQETIQHWSEEGMLVSVLSTSDSLGFHVTYLPMRDGGKAYINQIKAISNNLSR